MRALIARTLSSPIPLPLRRSLSLIHTAAGDDPHRRRSDSTPSPPSIRRFHDDESRTVKIAVWWDFESCSVPVGVNVFRVAQRITSGLRSSGIRGPVTINAFGDVAQLSRATQEALFSSGVCLTHVPHGGKTNSDGSFMADLIYWVSQNPPPAHFFLISGDKDFANILHRLRMNNYNVLLASTDSASGILCSAATVMWPWSGLAKGEDVAIKHFNYPPDGMYGSWYGYYKGALDDPFKNAEQTVASQPEESMEKISEVKPRPIPKAVVNGILQVLHSYPKGINLPELRHELKRNNITMDKDFFGHKKFSQLLSSMPSILRFRRYPSRDGQPLVVGIHKRTTELFEPSSKPAKESDNSDVHKCRNSTEHEKPQPPSPLPPPTALAKPSSRHKEVDFDTSVGTSAPPRGFDAVTEVRISEKKPTALAGHGTDKKEASLPSKDTDMDTTLDVSGFLKGENAEVEQGLFKRFRKIFYGETNGTISEVESTKQEDSPKEAAAVQNINHRDEVKPEEKTPQTKFWFKFLGYK